ncbi:MAG TPA: dihydrodipicolinate synthase family protein [Chthoniobacteraceae bacterium]|nr:dihydrodipicolinate synthase family protein [Chthoniobacteraceae bacterium]
MKHPILHGVLPVISTPFTADDRIDEAILQREIDWLYEQGVQGLVIGMVSEVTRLTDTERDRLAGLLVRGSRGRGPVVASVGAESVAQAVRHARAAEAAGVDAHMAVPPALTRCAPEEIRRYYSALIESTSRPVIIQDASGYIGNAIPLSLQASLYRDYPERVLFKPEAQPIGPNLSALRDLTHNEAAIFEGTGGIALVDSFRRGLAGTMPGSDLAWAVVALWKALQAGQWERLARIQGPLTAILAPMSNLDAFIATEKMLLKEQGIFVNTGMRGPVGYVLDPETRREILRQVALLQKL